MVKDATQAFLAVSGHKYPDGEHAPGKKTRWLRKLQQMNNTESSVILHMVCLLLSYHGKEIALTRKYSRTSSL